MHKLMLLLLVCTMIVTSTLAKAASDNGVILLYHHVSEDTPASTSISPEQFLQHMQYLKENHNVVPLEELVRSLQNHKALPEKAVAITFDDGYDNILHNAHPILRKFDFPYTVFINPELIGTLSQQLNWQQVKQMQQQGVHFANHTNQHQHLLLRSDQPSWLDNTIDDINNAQQLLQSKLSTKTKYLAYPYGEYNQPLAEAIKEQGYVGFGQHSGAVSSRSNFAALPRFPAAGNYAKLSSLKVKLNSLDMPLKDVSQQNPELTYNDRQPTFTATLDSDDLRPTQMACYFQGSALDLHWQGQQFTVKVPKPLPVGRSRLNCTAPSIKHSGRYYWFSQPWFVPGKDGQWPD